MRSVIALGVLVLLTASCATTPSAEQQRNADYGQPIAQQDAEVAAKAWLAPRLKDPTSAQYSCSAPVKGFVPNAPAYGLKMAFGYMLECSVNSKNSYGGYTGGKPYQFMFRDGRIIHVAHQECLRGGGCYMAPLK